MHELLPAHFIQEPYFYARTLTYYRMREFIRIAHPVIITMAGFILGYLVRHLQSRMRRKSYRQKRLSPQRR